MNESITSLTDLAAQANENHQLAVSTAGSALEFARLSGAALIEAKALVKHGEWLPWLESNFRASRFTAANYMKLVVNVESVQHLEPKSINEALRMIAGEDEDEEPKADLFEQEEEFSEPQHGAVDEDDEAEDDEETEEARDVAVEVVESESTEAMFPVSQTKPSTAAIKAGEDAEKDSEILWTLKKNWGKATKKDRATFINWIKANA